MSVGFDTTSGFDVLVGRDVPMDAVDDRDSSPEDRNAAEVAVTSDAGAAIDADATPYT